MTAGTAVAMWPRSARLQRGPEESNRPWRLRARARRWRRYLAEIGRIPLLDPARGAGPGPALPRRRRPARRPPARHRQPPLRGQGGLRVPLLRPAHGRPDPGGEHRPDARGAEVRSREGDPADLLRGLVDPRLHPEPHPALLVAGEGRHHPGAAEALLLHGPHPARARPGRRGGPSDADEHDRRDRPQAPGEALRGAGDVPAARRPRPLARRPARRRTAAPPTSTSCRRRRAAARTRRWPTARSSAPARASGSSAALARLDPRERFIIEQRIMADAAHSPCRTWATTSASRGSGPGSSRSGPPRRCGRAGRAGRARAAAEAARSSGAGALAGRAYPMPCFLSR